VSELEGKTARVHVNRLKAGPDGREVDASAPEQGPWLYARRVLHGVLGKRTVTDGEEYQVRKAGRNGFVWVGAEDLPDVVAKAHGMSSCGERAGTEVGPDVARGYLTAERLLGCPVGVACLPFKFVLTFLFAILTTGIGRCIGL
jgi:hypothetical protein